MLQLSGGELLLYILYEEKRLASGPKVSHVDLKNYKGFFLIWWEKYCPYDARKSQEFGKLLMESQITANLGTHIYLHCCIWQVIVTKRTSLKLK